MDVPRNAIVVGIDGSPESNHAVQWAFVEAQRTAAPVHLLHVLFDYAYGYLADQVVKSELIEGAEAVVARAERDRPADLAVPCTATWTWGSPAKVLVDASAQARMVVVGSRGRGGFAAAALGSVSQHVVRHASCPVVVVHGSGEDGDAVVVGLDLAAPDPALPAAFEAASQRDLPLTVVHAWHAPPIAGHGLGVAASGSDPDDYGRAARSAVNQELSGWRAKFPDVEVDVQVVSLHPTRALVDASQRARLVVVGPHGRGRFPGMLLGSTSAAVAAHAACPVLVAR